MRRNFYEADREAYREIARAFVEREVVPNQERWEREHDTGRHVGTSEVMKLIIGRDLTGIH